jgi:iron(III) transport system substrate-binding protein
VVAYVSVDRSIAEPVLIEFQRQNGVRVLAVYDTEANKTTGLVNRLVAEAANPKADVYWSGEIAQTLQLDEREMLAPVGLPVRLREPRFRGAEGRWYGFAARARVLLARADVPTRDGESSLTIEGLAAPGWAKQVAIADPHFGTTRSHLAVLLELWGEARFEAWLKGLRENRVHIMPGNAQVRDAVAAGTVSIGLTDSDDAMQAVAGGAPVRMIMARQSHEFGAVFIPNTAALIRGAPNAKGGQQLLEHLLSKDVEERLVAQREVFYPTRTDVGEPVLHDLVRDSEPKSFGTLAGAQRRMLELVEAEWFGRNHSGR